MGVNLRYAIEDFENAKKKIVPSYLRPEAGNKLNNIYPEAQTLWKHTNTIQDKKFSVDRPFTAADASSAAKFMPPMSPRQSPSSDRQARFIPNLSSSVMPKQSNQLLPITPSPKTPAEVAGAPLWKCTHNYIPSYHKLYYDRLA
eukprot:CAMPEP_0196572076 /NCGR_PEP_ID=MMETSP1081-20130531/2191_1 /TAXON_ID=36882 /ORGANISM="Pyramimonas amylifera, Strain CCMP720" /LENGTH=143 /DNA_ID=CAMNT_0041889269 /DNA_START=242 /DNA_END=673 /DNA_ORIENTATION=+